MRRKIFNSLIVLLLICTVSGGFSGCAFNQSSDPLPHLISAAERETDSLRPYNENLEEVEIKSASNSLQQKLEIELRYLTSVIQSGKKPVTTGCHISVNSVIASAEKVLADIILKSMTDYEKIHAIHDYLSYYIDYDNELYENYLNNNSSIDAYNAAFDVRGVLLNKKAVCEGISETFVLLCGMENIRAVRISGTANSNGQEIPHGWNRVLLDNIWYNIDCTYDALNINFTNSNTTKKFLSHSYFLVDTKSMTTHTANTVLDCDASGRPVTYSDLSNYTADIYSGYYENESLTDILSYSANSQEELNNIFKYVKQSKKRMGKIEIRINFIDIYDDKVWDTAISSAYKKVSNANYGKDAAIRSINNVVFCLIYR